MKRLVVLLLCSLPYAAHADVDGALSAVHAAQSAIEGDASCKSLPTKLKLAVEALERAQKAPVKVNVEQAKGRLETAKDFVATACSTTARATVTERIASALTALEHVGGKAKSEKQGASFQSKCRANDECASEHCFVGASGEGYCSKTCTTATDCPVEWACRRPGSEPGKICIR